MQWFWLPAIIILPLIDVVSFFLDPLLLLMVDLIVQPVEVQILHPETWMARIQQKFSNVPHKWIEKNKIKLN